MSAQKFIKKKAKTGEKKLKPTRPVEEIVAIAKEKKEEIIIPPGKMKICVIGLGATGGLIAAYLKSKRRQVTAIGNLEDKRVIRSNGLKVEGGKDSVFVALDVQDEMQHKPDLVILATKTQDINTVIDRNRKFLENTLILSTQNYVKADQAIATNLGKDNIISSIIYFGSTCLKTGLIKHDFEGDWIIGKTFGANDDKIKEIAEEIAPAFKVTIVEDIVSMKWTQLIIQATYCFAAMLGKNISEAFANPDMAKIGALLLRENLAIADDSGIKLADLPNLELSKLRQLIALPDQEAAQQFSMLMNNFAKQPQDAASLNKFNLDYLSDIDYFSGELIRLGRFGRVGAQLNTKAVNLVNRVKKANAFLKYEEVIKVFSQN